MTIIQLEYFLAVVNHGSFSTAAEYCFVTQPTLSTQISNLEDELGVVLLNRNSKPIVPTEAGESVLKQARQAIAAFYSTKETVSDLKGELVGKLRLGVIPTISPYLMPEFIPRFIKKCPDVQLDIRDMHTTDLVDALGRDMVDIAILSGGQSTIKIREIDLFDDKLYLYVSRKNELYEHKEVLIEEIDVKKLLILSAGNCLRNQTLQLCKARKKIRLQYDFMSCSLETLIHTADATGGTTIIPGMTIRYIPEENRRQIKPFGKVYAHRKITMAVGNTCVRESLINAVGESIRETKEAFDLQEFLLP